MYTKADTCKQKLQESNRVMKLDLSEDSVFITERKIFRNKEITRVTGRAKVEATVRDGRCPRYQRARARDA